MNDTGAGDLSVCVRDRKYGLYIPTCSAVMKHYACRPPGNEPPLTEDEVGRKIPVSRVWSVTQSRVPLHSLDEPSWSNVQTLPDLMMGLDWSRCMNVLYNEWNTQRWVLIHSSAAHIAHSPKTFLSLPYICEYVFFWLSLIELLLDLNVRPNVWNYYKPLFHF